MAVMAYPGVAADYHGFARHDFSCAGCAAILVAPREAAAGRPWVWRAEFFDAFPGVDLALLAAGYHLAYLHVGNTFGCPSALRHWDPFYAYLTGDIGLSPRPALEGLSRGGLYIYNWAAAHPAQVGCLFADNPVCDFKSWPGGKGAGPGSPEDWAKLLRDYGFASEDEALAYPGNPVDNLAPLAAAQVPALHLFGDADDVVPWEENTGLLAARYRALGGPITLIRKAGARHHPHGLDDPAPVVTFIRQHCG